MVVIENTEIKNVGELSEYVDVILNVDTQLVFF